MQIILGPEMKFNFRSIDKIIKLVMVILLPQLKRI